MAVIWTPEGFKSVNLPFESSTTKSSGGRSPSNLRGDEVVRGAYEPPIRSKPQTQEVTPDQIKVETPVKNIPQTLSTYTPEQLKSFEENLQKSGYKSKATVAAALAGQSIQNTIRRAGIKSYSYTTETVNIPEQLTPSQKVFIEEAAKLTPEKSVSKALAQSKGEKSGFFPTLWGYRERGIGYLKEVPSPGQLISYGIEKYLGVPSLIPKEVKQIEKEVKLELGSWITPGLGTAQSITFLGSVGEKYVRKIPVTKQEKIQAGLIVAGGVAKTSLKGLTKEYRFIDRGKPTTKAVSIITPETKTSTKVTFRVETKTPETKIYSTNLLRESFGKLPKERVIKARTDFAQPRKPLVYESGILKEPVIVEAQREGAKMKKLFEVQEDAGLRLTKGVKEQGIWDLQWGKIERVGKEVPKGKITETTLDYTKGKVSYPISLSKSSLWKETELTKIYDSRTFGGGMGSYDIKSKVIVSKTPTKDVFGSSEGSLYRSSPIIKSYRELPISKSESLSFGIGKELSKAQRASLSKAISKSDKEVGSVGFVMPKSRYYGMGVYERSEEESILGTSSISRRSLRFDEGRKTVVESRSDLLGSIKPKGSMISRSNEQQKQDSNRRNALRIIPRSKTAQKQESVRRNTFKGLGIPRLRTPPSKSVSERIIKPIIGGSRRKERKFLRGRTLFGRSRKRSRTRYQASVGSLYTGKSKGISDEEYKKLSKKKFLGLELRPSYK